MGLFSRLIGKEQPKGALQVEVEPEPVMLPKAFQPETLKAAPQSELLAEKIKLIIWDLDDTFWTGTLSEGGVTPIEAHMEVVRTLNRRGIVNSICSKNDFDSTKAALERHGMWDEFIFPRIAFAPKGEMIRDIIAAAQLRTPSVLFIDDNPMNIQEALHYNPGLQVCEPDAISALLDDPRCHGKPDPGLARLANYRVLEAKFLAQANANSDNIEFLRQSEIRISFHHDVLEQFPRIHDLVNRTNQLNFTKKRWPEDPAKATKVFEIQRDWEFETSCGYVKVSDKYGSYGIVGFYMRRKTRLGHFLFSCRTMNMGVEQFVWHQLGRPAISIVGEVISKLDDKPDWITVVDDADDRDEAHGDKIKICLRGACDMSMISHYLRIKHDTIEEFNNVYDGWIVSPVARAVALEDELKASEPARELVKLLPGMPMGGFKSCINSGEADVYVMSFSPEWFPSYYRSNSTNFLFPIGSHPLRGMNFAKTEFSKAEAAGKIAGTGLNQEKWEFLQRELEFCGLVDEKQLAADVQRILDKLAGKLVIVISLNTKFGSEWDFLAKHRRIDSIVMPIVRASGCHVIDLGEFVQGTGDLAADGQGGHFKREVYHGLANRILQIVEAEHLPAAVSTLSNMETHHPLASEFDPEKRLRQHKVSGIHMSQYAGGGPAG